MKMWVWGMMVFASVLAGCRQEAPQTQSVPAGETSFAVLHLKIDT